jgi:hypothetical protein
LSAYSSSKSALDSAVAHWQEEYPHIRFIRATLGPTLPTEFLRNLDNAILPTALERWSQSGVDLSPMVTGDVADALLELVMTVYRNPSIAIRHVEMSANRSGDPGRSRHRIRERL